MYNYINLDKKLYPLFYIERAIRDYRQVATIQVTKSEEKYVTCSVICEKESFEEIKNEFCNYLIALISTATK